MQAALPPQPAVRPTDADVPRHGRSHAHLSQGTNCVLRPVPPPPQRDGALSRRIVWAAPASLLGSGHGAASCGPDQGGLRRGCGCVSVRWRYGAGGRGAQDVQRLGVSGLGSWMQMTSGAHAVMLFSGLCDSLSARPRRSRPSRPTLRAECHFSTRLWGEGDTFGTTGEWSQ